MRWWAGWIGGAIDYMMPAGPLRDLLVDGIVGGVGAVIVFLPNIMILYLCSSRSWRIRAYLARAAFIMDRVMHRIGLHGKSFIPLIMGIRLQRPGDHGLPDDRESKQSPDHHTHYPFHVMQRANSDLPVADGDVLRSKTPDR